MVNTNVGTPKPKKLEDICEDDFSWDGDVLADMGVGFIECQNSELERHSTVKNEWKVQGRRGTNPVKTKTSSVKGPSLLKKGNPSGDRVSRKWGNRDFRIIGVGLNDDETDRNRIEEREIVKANPSHFLRADSPSEKPAWVVESCLRDKRGSCVASGKQVRIDECAQARGAGKDSPEPKKAFKEKELRSVLAPSVGALPHSATKEFIDTNQAGAKPSLPGLERVKDANPDLLWDSPLENHASNGVVSVNNKEAKSISDKKGRHNLDWYKCYLDSCASYHTFFIRKFLKNI